MNIFSSLFKYGHGVDENYLTEALAFLVKLLLQRTPLGGLELANLLSGERGGPLFSDPSSVTVSTQVAVEEGRPDIEIRDGPSTVVYLEVKHDSGLGVDQLERYKAQLDESGIPNTRLVLLTRSRIACQQTTLLPSE
jgi:hypothetical protein